jgi:predicted ATPase with chaperone activity
MPIQFSRRTMVAMLGGSVVGPVGPTTTAWGHDLRPDDPSYRFHHYENIVNRTAQIKQVYQWPNIANASPFRAPHHTISDAGLVGGGAGTPRPGEASLAHNRVLFLDELPEFPRNVLEQLRQPLEDNALTIARANMTLAFPAKFILVAAMNPCPRGF